MNHQDVDYSKIIKTVVAIPVPLVQMHSQRYAKGTEAVDINRLITIMKKKTRYNRNDKTKDQF